MSFIENIKKVAGTAQEAVKSWSETQKTAPQKSKVVEPVKTPAPQPVIEQPKQPTQPDTIMLQKPTEQDDHRTALAKIADALQQKAVERYKSWSEVTKTLQQPKYGNTQLSAPGTKWYSDDYLTTKTASINKASAYTNMAISAVKRANERDAEIKKIATPELERLVGKWSVQNVSMEKLKQQYPDIIANATKKYELEKQSTQTKGIQDMFIERDNWIKDKLNLPHGIPTFAVDKLLESQPEKMAELEQQYQHYLDTTLRPGEALQQLKTQNKLVEANLQEEKYKNLKGLERAWEKTVDFKTGQIKNLQYLVDAFGSSLTGIEAHQSLIDDPTISQKVLSAVGGLGGFLVGLAGVGKLTTGAKIANALSKITKSQRAISTLTALTKASVDFSLLGQAQSFVRNDSLKEHLDRIGPDLASGALYTAMGMGVGKLPKVLQPLVEAGLWTGISKLQGASNEDAIIQGVLMGGMRAFGVSQPKRSFETAVGLAEKTLKISRNSTPEEIVKAYEKESVNIKPNSEEGYKLQSSVMTLLYQDKAKSMFAENRKAGLMGMGEFKSGQRPGLEKPAPLPKRESLETPSVKDFNKYKEQFSDIKFKNADDMKIIRDTSTGEIIGVQNRAGEKGMISGEKAILPSTTKEIKASSGANKTSKLESKVYQRLIEEIPESMREEVTYKEMTLKEDAKKAVELLDKDKAMAYNVAMGYKEPPKNQTATAVNILLAEKALGEGNYQLYSQLTKMRSLAQTKRGQEIVAEKNSVTDNSTSRYVKELLSLKLDKLGKNYTSEIEKLKSTSPKERAMKRIKNEVVKAKEKINKTKLLDIQEAQKIIDQLTCK